MATITLPPITFRQLPQSINQMRGTFNEGILKRGFLLPMANRMLRETQDEFKDGTDINGHQWQSNSVERKFGGRWSVNYITRPSGGRVIASDTRLVDRGKLRDSYKIIKCAVYKIIVGPVGDLQEKIAHKAQTSWKNAIVGWTDKRLNAANKKFEEYMIARARKRLF